jgi:ABC-2 type transport system permease protein
MTLIRHELRRGWKSLLIWTGAISAFLVICLLIFPEMKNQMDSISTLFASMGAFTKAFGMETLNFGTLTGFYGIECGNILGIGGALFAALLGISALSREEKDGTAELLLTHPLSRTEVVTRKLIAILIQIVILNAVVFLLTIGSIACIGEPVPWKEIGLLHLAFFLLQLEIAAVCYGISACIWRGGMGIGLGLAIALYFMNIIANLTEKAEFLKYITPFGYADGAAILSKGSLDGIRVAVGMAFAAAGIVLAYWKYNRKDIR